MATIGVCVFSALTTVDALFIIKSIGETKNEKTMFKLISAILMLCMLITVFAACSDNYDPIDASVGKSPTKESDTMDSDKAESDQTKPDTPSIPTAMTEPISYRFISNGDGTCSLTNIYINNKTLKNIELELPSKSPAGDTVTKIAFQCATTYGNVPSMILPEDFDAFIKDCENQAEDDVNKRFLMNKIKSYYVLQNPDGVSGAPLAEMQKDYPVTKVTAIYVLEPTAMATGIEQLSQYMYDFGYTKEKCQADFQKLVTTVKQSPLCTQEILGTIKEFSPHISDIISVTIPEGVKIIGENAFANWNKMQSISISNGLETIGDNAFSGCTELKNISIPDSISKIGDNTFYNCTNLKYNEYDNAYYLGNTNNPYVGLIKAKSRDIISCKISDSTKFIYVSAFENCTNLMCVTLGNSVTSIGDDAFLGCDKLVEVYNLSSLNVTKENTSYGYVGYYALNVYTSKNEGSKLHTTNDGYIFYEDGSTIYLMGYVGSNTELILPDNYNGNNYAIYQYAFDCNNFTSVTITTGITSIGNYAFNYGHLNAVYITDIVTWCNIDFGYNRANPLHYAHNLYLNGTLVTNLVIPESITSIKAHTFEGCTSLNSVTIPNCVESIGEGAFNGCINLNAVHITDIEAWCNIDFDGDTANPLCYAYNLYLNETLVTNLTIPDNVTSVKSYTFYGCKSLESVTIPDHVEYIGSVAFADCSNLTIYVEATSQPSGWEEYWNGDIIVFWNYIVE